jgi:hypothetical protein
MPRFTPDDEARFKMTMLPRAPHYVFNDEDKQRLEEFTGKERSVIENWEKCFRYRMTKKSPAYIEKLLKGHDETIEVNICICAVVLN